MPEQNSDGGGNDRKAILSVAVLIIITKKERKI